MKLALVIASLGDGGAERVMSLLANLWVDRGDEITLITLESTRIDAYALDPRVNRVALELVEDSRGLLQALANNWRRLTALRGAVRASGASVALSFVDTTNVLVVWSLLGLPVRCVLSERTDPTKHPIGPAWEVLRRVTYPLADALVVQTDRLLPWARRVMLGRRRVHAIPNPLRSMSGPVPTEAGVLAAPDKPMIVALGRLWAEKGYDVLLRAFSKLASEFPQWSLTIIGEGPERESLTTLARTLGIGDRLSLPGWMPMPEEVLRKADIFVMSSRYEGFSNATLEALGAGLPVVSTACGGSEEMITPGVNGFVVPVDAADELADALRQLIKDGELRERMGRNAFEASQKYAPRAIMPRWDAVLGNAAASSRQWSDPGAEALPVASFRGAPKILLLTRRLDIGGAERQLVELAVGLHGIGWQVKVVTFYPGGVLASRLEEAGVPVLSLDKSGRWDLFGFSHRLVKLVRRERPDILHSYLETSNVLLALLRSCFGRARIVWGVRASNMDLTQYGRLAVFEARLGVMLSRFADLIICNSASGKAYHVGRGYPSGKMMVVSNGVDVTRFAPDAASRESVRAEWGVARGEILVGIVARLDPMKDHRNFIRAAAQVANLRADVRFVCIGDGPPAYRDALLAEARALGLESRIIWAGARNDMPRVYNALDLAVSSSAFGEGFPNTIVEAMATDVPCVVTDVGDSAAIVGELGWVCPPSDSAALCKAMVSAIGTAPREGGRIREHVVSSYSSAMLLERTMAALTTLIPTRAAVVGQFRWRRG